MSKAVALATKLLLNPKGSLYRIMPRSERMALLQGLRGEEGDGIAEIVIRISDTYGNMPVTYGQDGNGDDAIVYLHYFHGGIDAWITEKDMSGLPEEGDYDQAFGLQSLGGGIKQAGLGYISLIELAENGIELDLHWTPKTLREVKADL